MDASREPFGARELKHGKQADEKNAVVQTDMPKDIVASSNNQQKQQCGNRGGESINFMEHHLDKGMKEVLVY